MKRAHLTVAVAVLAAASLGVARSLETPTVPLVAATPPVERTSEPVIPEPPPQARIVRTLPRAPSCPDGGAVVVAHELSGSILQGRALGGTRLTEALEVLRDDVPEDWELGVVAFARRLWTGTQAAVEPQAPAWLPIGSDASLSIPDDVGESIGTCANLALGLDAAIANLSTAEGARALWLVVDGLHDCNADGRFAYVSLTPAVDRAHALGIDVSLLVVDPWSERRGPTPLHGLARGNGAVVRAPAWELDAAYGKLLATLRPPGC